MNRRATAISLCCVLLVALGVTGSIDGAPLVPASPSSPTGGKFPDLTGVGEGGLAVHAVQGTPDGPEVRNAPVTVELQHRGTTVRTLEGELDDYGVVVFEGLAVSPAVQPVVSIEYAGVVYQQVGTLLDAANPQQLIDVVCYEVTDATPDWRLTMSHVMLSHEPGGIRVTQVAVIDNPATQTWIGTARGLDRPVTVAFPVTPEARDVRLGRGFHGWCCTSALPGELVNHLPLMPETTELNYSFVVPAHDGVAAFDVIAPAATDHMMLIVPDDVGLEPTGALQLGGTDVIADTAVRYYLASDVAGGTRTRLVLTGLSSIIPQPAATGINSGTIAKIVGAVGAAVLLIAAIAMFVRAPKPDASGVGS